MCDSIIIGFFDDDGLVFFEDEGMDIFLVFDDIIVFFVYLSDSGLVLFGIKYVVYILCDIFGFEVVINVEKWKKVVVF